MPLRREAILAFAVLCFAGCQKKDQGTVLARVGGGDAVTVSDFQREMEARPFARQEYLETLPGRKEMLELLVRRRVVMAEAERAGFADRADVKQKLADIENEVRRQREEARERVVVGEFFRHLQQNDLKVTEQ